MNKDLIEQYKLLHGKKAGYGSGKGFGGQRYFNDLIEFLEKGNCKTVLDFGCGKGELAKELNKLGFECQGYDPAIKVFHTFPNKKFDCVVSTDVFEHLDKDDMHEEFTLIKSVKPKYLFFNVATREAGNVLPNGLNCHTIVENSKWWQDTIEKSFEDYKITKVRDNSHMAHSVIMHLELK
tara:strand:- start:598 stop:1137 length:540 start_codon:yes stop_codon:yes gene_type:complete